MQAHHALPDNADQCEDPLPVDHAGHLCYEPGEGAAGVAEGQQVSYVAVILVHCQRQPASCQKEEKWRKKVKIHKT